MEPENDGFEDDVPFLIGGFLASILIFRGVHMFTHVLFN